MLWLPKSLHLAALTAFLLTSLPHGGLVLCIGPEGHLAFESSNASCCKGEASCAGDEPGTPAASSSRLESSGGACVHRCCRCLDLPFPPSLGHRIVKVEKSTGVERPSPSGFAIPPELISCPSACLAGGASCQRPPPDLALRPSRHPILRC